MLRISPMHREHLLGDPVYAARTLLSIQFDAFQAFAFRIGWFVPNVIDESGFGTGKSLRIWAKHALRCVLMEGQWTYAYYQTFQAGKSIFWPYFRSAFARNKIFQAHLGKVDFEGEKDGKDNTLGQCYTQHYKNGSQCQMGAPNWLQNAVGQAGFTLNFASLDEWTKIEAMGKRKDLTHDAMGNVVGGIDQQIYGRLRKENFNQFHPLWGNHILFSATAESTNHPSQARINSFKQEIKDGNPNFAIISFSFKDVSSRRSHTGKPFKDQIIDWSAVTRMKGKFSRSHFKRECLGIRSRETKGWYSEEDLQRCIATGIANGLEPCLGRNN